MASLQVRQRRQNQVLVFVGIDLSLLVSMLAWLQYNARQEIVERTKEAVCSDNKEGEIANAEGMKVRCD